MPGRVRGADRQSVRSADATTSQSASRDCVRAQAPRPRLRLLEDEVESDAGLVADNPGIVAGGGDERPSWADFDFSAVLRTDPHPTGDHVADVLSGILA